MDDKKKKSSKKDREKDLRNDGFKKVGSVNYDAVMDRQVGDKRFERERSFKLGVQEKGVAALNEPKPAVR